MFDRLGIEDLWGRVFMRRAFLFGLGVVAGCLALSTVVQAGGPDPADYPLRVHVLKNTSQPRNTRENKNLSDSPDYVDGQGVADLFENGEPRGFQFSYSCIGGLKASSGYGTYPARWRKREKTLEILVPREGKSWNLDSCGLRTEMRPGLVFYFRNGQIAEESAKLLKDWMVQYKYDPEKDLSDPAIEGGGPFDDSDFGSSSGKPE
jgi:hypothetical protein